MRGDSQDRRRPRARRRDRRARRPVFKGLPFAGPTGGANRFRPPQPVEPWQGTRTADAWGDQALQDVKTNPVGTFWGDEYYYDPAFMPRASETGLNLNVWTPAKANTDKLPVYVWIHGGANHHGFASEIEFQASKLAAKGIVVVAIQYRVGPMGFFALPELSEESPDKVSGNYATLDQIKALQWVRDNIAGFGGDPANVTIGGQSAGARNSTMLLRSPLAKGLFHRAVIESGTNGLFPAPMLTLAEREKASQKGVEEVFGKPMTVADPRELAREGDVVVTANYRLPPSFDLGVPHSAELPYVWGERTVPAGLTSEQRKLATLMRGYWTRLSDRKTFESAALGEWPAYQPNDRRRIVFHPGGETELVRREDYLRDRHCDLFAKRTVLPARSDLAARRHARDLLASRSLQPGHSFDRMAEDRNIPRPSLIRRPVREAMDGDATDRVDRCIG